MPIDPTIPSVEKLRHEHFFGKPIVRLTLLALLVLLIVGMFIGISTIDSAAHDYFTLASGSYRLKLVGECIAVCSLIAIATLKFINRYKGWYNAIFGGLFMGILMGIFAGGAVDVLNTRLADTSKTYIRQVQVVAHGEYESHHSDKREHGYNVKVKTLDDGEVYVSKKSGNRPHAYYYQIEQGGVYNAKVSNGYFGVPFIVEFGERIR